MTQDNRLAPLTYEELLNIKPGTILWAVLVDRFSPKAFRALHKITVSRTGMINSNVYIEGTIGGERGLVLSTSSRDFYTNYWDAYRVVRKGEEEKKVLRRGI